MVKSSKSKIIKVITAVIVITAVAAAAYMLLGRRGSNTAYEEESAELRNISTYYSFTGNVETDNDAKVLSNTSQKVLSVNVSEGDTVSRGDVIAVLDSSDIEKNISVKEAGMDSSELSDSYNIMTARQTYEDYKSGIENGKNSQLNSAKSTLDSAKNSLESARKKYDDAKAELENSTDSTLLSARKTLENAKSDLADAQKDYDDYLSEISEEDYDSIKTQKENKDEAYKKYTQKIMGNIDDEVSRAGLAYQNAKSNYEYLYELSKLDNTLVDNDDLSNAKSEMEKTKTEYENLSAENMTVNEFKEAYDEAVKNYEDAKKEIDDSHDSQLKSLSKSLENAQRTYDNAVQSLEDTEKSLNKNIDTYYDSYISAQRSYEEAVNNYETVKLSVEQTLDSYKTSYDKTVELSGSVSDSIELENLYKSLKDCTIYANADGVISELNVSAGGYISANQTAAVITDYTKLKIIIKIDEYDVGKVNVGDKLDIYINALDKNIDGVIESISSKAETSGGVSYFSADVSFEADENIRAGMTAEVKLVSRKSNDAVSIPVEALNYNQDNSAYVLVKGAAEEPEVRAVSVGVSDGTYIEITEGLSQGEVVLYVSGDFSGMPVMTGGGPMEGRGGMQS